MNFDFRLGWTLFKVRKLVSSSACSQSWLCPFNTFMHTYTYNVAHTQDLAFRQPIGLYNSQQTIHLVCNQKLQLQGFVKYLDYSNCYKTLFTVYHFEPLSSSKSAGTVNCHPPARGKSCAAANTALSSQRLKWERRQQNLWPPTWQGQYHALKHKQRNHHLFQTIALTKEIFNKLQLWLYYILSIMHQPGGPLLLEVSFKAQYSKVKLWMHM